MRGSTSKAFSVSTDDDSTEMFPDACYAIQASGEQYDANNPVLERLLVAKQANSDHPETL